MFAQGKVTTDRVVIKKWAQARKGWPAIIQKVTGAGVEMVPTIVLPGAESGEVIRRLTWKEFFEWFDKLKLAFVYEDTNPNHKLSLGYALI